MLTFTIIVILAMKKSSYKNYIVSDSKILCLELIQVEFRNRYLRENISFTRKNDIRNWDQSTILDMF